MTNPERIAQVIETITKAWVLNPELRLCQLIENALMTKNYIKGDFDHNSHCIYYVTDAMLEKAIKENYNVS